jgi:hypothetical protein
MRLVLGTLPSPRPTGILAHAVKDAIDADVARAACKVALLARFRAAVRNA